MTNINIFIDILSKKNTIKKANLISKFLYHYRLRKFKKMINKSSPSFDFLWSISEFIKYAELLFMYDNSVNNYLYSSSGYKDAENGFVAFSKEKNVKVIIKLFANTQKVSLCVERCNGSKLSTLMNFKDGKWCKEPTIYDEIILEQAIRVINANVLNLLDWCFDMA